MYFPDKIEKQISSRLIDLRCKQKNEGLLPCRKKIISKKDVWLLIWEERTKN